MKDSKFTIQLAKFGIEVCNTAHDINNSLAIIMGYAENLELMLETNKLDKVELQNVCDKIFHSIDQLNKESRHIASQRRATADTEQNRDFTDFFHRWLKIQTPIMTQHNMIWNLLDGTEAIMKLDWTRVLPEIANIFDLILEQWQFNETQRFDVSTRIDENGYHIDIRSEGYSFQAMDFPSFLEHPTLCNVNDGTLTLSLTCFSEQALAKSQA